MAKEDLGPPPEVVPRKAKQIKGLADVHLAMLLERDLAPSERKKLEAEKADRRRRNPDVAVGILVDDAGASPEQLDALKLFLANSGATSVHHPWASSRVNTAAKSVGVPVEVHKASHTVTHDDTMKEVVRVSDTVIALPKEMNDPIQKEGTGVWEMVKYTKHRNTPVTVIRPDGSRG